MVKKLKEIAIKIKALLDLNFNPIDIARKLKISKQRMNYWKKTPIIVVKNRITKLNEEFKQKVIHLAKNKLTSEMESRKNAHIINKKLKTKQVVDNNGKRIQIQKSAIFNYLRNFQI